MKFFSEKMAGSEFKGILQNKDQLQSFSKRPPIKTRGISVNFAAILDSVKISKVGRKLTDPRFLDQISRSPNQMEQIHKTFSLSVYFHKQIQELTKQCKWFWSNFSGDQTKGKTPRGSEDQRCGPERTLSQTKWSKSRDPPFQRNGCSFVLKRGYLVRITTVAKNMMI